MFGATFYTLTGTHGVHVAIGVVWLVLMIYVRTFQPVDASARAPGASSRHHPVLARASPSARPWPSP
jgi:cytochrome o ubiquinol oxidase subunit III